MTLDEAHKIIDTRTATAFAGTLVLYENSKSSTPSEGDDPYIKQRVQIGKMCQAELGNLERKRIHGSVVFEFYARTGVGPADHTMLQQKLLNYFVGKLDQGLTFENVHPRGSTDRFNWKVNTFEATFFFYNYP